MRAEKIIKAAAGTETVIKQKSNRMGIMLSIRFLF